MPAILDLRRLLNGEFEDLLTVSPEAILELVAGIINDTIAVLLAVAPGPRVGRLLRTHVDSVAVAFVKLVEALVASPIGIVLHTEPIDLLVLPLARELAPIRKFVSAKPFDD